MVGQSLVEQGVTAEIVPSYYSVKEAVFPFIKFPGVDTMLGPEMKSTGEVMGVAAASAKHSRNRSSPPVLRSHVRAACSSACATPIRNAVIEVHVILPRTVFELLATRGTAVAIEAAGVLVKQVNKVSEGRPHIVDMLMNDEIDVIINTVSDKQSLADAYAIRREALQHKVTHYTTLAAARAAAEAHRMTADDVVNRLQDLHRELHG